MQVLEVDELGGFERVLSVKEDAPLVFFCGFHSAAYRAAVFCFGEDRFVNILCVLAC